MADLYRVTTLFSGPLVNGGGISQLYFNGSAGSAAQALTAAQTFWNAARAVIHVSTSIATSGDVEEMSLAGAVTGVVDAGDNVSTVGTDDSDPLPPATQTIVHWRTGAYFNGRERRGRLFLPCGGESYSVAGVPGGTRKSDLQSAVNALVADANSSLVVYSRTYHGLANVTVGQVGSKFAVLRSRRD